MLNVRAQCGSYTVSDKRETLRVVLGLVLKKKKVSFAVVYGLGYNM